MSADASRPTPAGTTVAATTGRDGAAPGHVFDDAIRLVPEAPGVYRGETSAAYGNMVGPFGGITAATMLNAACLHPERLGEPVSLTVNYAGPVADGAFRVAARPVRTNRATQHWWIELSQDGVVATTATAVFAIRRETWASTEASAPPAPAPNEAERWPIERARVAWVRNYEMRFVRGAFPDPRRMPMLDDSTSLLWVRDDPPRPLDPLSLVALSDVFFPRTYLRAAQIAPAGTITITTTLHADAAMLARQGTQPVLARAQAQAFGGGFFDQASAIWGEGGAMLASSHQTVYFK
ncbi:MAG: thioesterase family protein [Limnobacter sp.]|nr:thioesterase family protein [Limnobacter sp.]